MRTQDQKAVAIIVMLVLVAAMKWFGVEPFEHSVLW